MLAKNTEKGRASERYADQARQEATHLNSTVYLVNFLNKTPCADAGSAAQYKQQTHLEPPKITK